MAGRCSVLRKPNRVSNKFGYLEKCQNRTLVKCARKKLENPFLGCPNGAKELNLPQNPINKSFYSFFIVNGDFLNEGYFIGKIIWQIMFFSPVKHSMGIPEIDFERLFEATFLFLSNSHSITL